MLKEVRQNKILSLIRSHRMSTQEELQEFLERDGVPATQSSISRDLEELRIVKLNGHYTIPSPSGRAASRGLLELKPAGDAIVVAKCEAGLASAVAVGIDRAGIEEIVGTLAGEDTVLIAVEDKKAQRTVIRKVWEIFE
jgi:transcriptional regulator of arginine metabolism